MKRHLRAVPGDAPKVQAPLADAMAERELLAAVMMLDGEKARAALAVVQHEDWTLDRHRDIHAAMLALIDRGVGIEAETLRHALTDAGHWERIGGARALCELLDRQGHCTSVGQYAKRVRRLSLQRQIASEWQAGVSDVLEGVERETRMAALSKLEADLAALDTPRVTSRTKVMAMLDRIDNPIDREVVSTGLPALDDKLDGGLCPGWLVVVLGAPKMGKTVLATNVLGLSVLRHGFPLLYCGEMGEDEVMARWLAAESGVPLRAQRRGDLSHEQRSHVSGAADTMSRWIWSVKPIGDVARIEADALAFKAEHGHIGMLVVDYLQLVNNGNENRVNDLEQTTRGLKLLAAKLACPVVLVSQPNNDAAKSKTELGLFDGKGSGSIAADCDLCLVPVRDEQNMEIAGILAPGYRHGEAFRLNKGSLRFNGARMVFQ